MNLQDSIEKVYYLRNSPSTNKDKLEDFLSIVINICKARASAILNIAEKNQLKLLANINLDKADSFLELCLRALKNNYAFEKLDYAINHINNPLIVALKLLGSNQHILLIVCDKLDALPISDILLRASLILDIPLNQKIEATKTNIYFETILTILASVINQKQFVLFAMTLVNEILAKFLTYRVSLALIEDDFAKIIAISHTEKIAQYTDNSQNLISLMEEAADQNCEIHYPKTNNEIFITEAHFRYSNLYAIKEILSLPLRVEDSVRFVLVIEKLTPFLEEEVISLRLLANYLAPILNSIYINDLSFFKKLKYKLRQFLEFCLGVEKSFLKLFVILISLLIAFLVFGKLAYKIDANAYLVTDEINYVSAPFDSLVDEVIKQSGDFVKKGEPLLNLDTQDLYLKLGESEAEYSRYLAEEKKARAENRLADMNIVKAKLLQTEAELSRIKKYISLASLKAPRDGVIVEGETKSLIGAPLAKGSTIFQIVNPINIYLELRLSEKDIAKIALGDLGEFALLANPKQSFKFKINKIIPMAKVDGAFGNVFSVYATILDENPEWFRPGMNGSAKIFKGQENAFFVLTNQVQDRLMMYFWW